MTDPRFPGKTNGQLAQDDLAWTLSQACTVRCAYCTWMYDGLAGDGQEAFTAHRLVAHPEIVPVKHRRKGFSQRVAARGRRRALELRQDAA